MRGEQYTFQLSSCRIESVEQRGGGVVDRERVFRRGVVRSPTGPAWKNERFGNVHEGTSQNQWSNVAKPRAMPETTGMCAGCTRS